MENKQPPLGVGVFIPGARTAEADAPLPEVFQDQHKLFQRPRQTV